MLSCIHRSARIASLIPFDAEPAYSAPKREKSTNPKVPNLKFSVTTTTCCCSASTEPSNSFADPFLNAPPCIQTSTGANLDMFFGVYIFMNKQSSLTFPGIFLPSASTIFNCIARLGNDVASNVFFQLPDATDGLNLRSLVGGSPYLIPKNV